MRSINGIVANSRRGGLVWNTAFLRAVEALERLSELGGGGVHFVDNVPVYRLTEASDSAEIRAAQQEMREALSLDPDVTEYKVVVSTQRLSGRELTLSTASALDVLNLLASRFDVPESHVARGWTFATPNPSPGRTELAMLAPIHVRAGDAVPDDVFIATRNRGAWFWIDDGDYASKRAFSLLTMLLTLSESSSRAAPVVTIGAGGG